MLYEMRTYTLKPGMVGEYEKRFAEAYEVRQNYSKLGAMFRTEIGNINNIRHFWQYNDLQERADIRAKSAQDPSGKWPPKTPELLVNQEVTILDPVKGMPDWDGPKEWGTVYELRIYSYSGADIGKAAEAFGEALAGRHAVYPVAGMFTSQQGDLGTLYQLFPYKNWAHREEVRTEFRKQGVWPPRAEVRPQRQRVEFLLPSSFSPLH
jgi:hypothetical protein